MGPRNSNTARIRIKSVVSTPLTVEPTVVAELEAVLAIVPAEEVDEVTVDGLDEEDTPLAITSLMALTFQIRIAVLLHKNGRL
jgi:hypothetical protein